ncbi:MAG: peptidoglycan-associated lipoprotein Pal [Thermodesulfobacteriota bacterium]|jgi:peptidoglycan-associated lipoprotein|nr:MAG: peptidoglycan-associated lipoprotein Pal [Thermodesulfobacteriota bacterium]
MTKKWVKGLSLLILLILVVALSGCACAKKATPAAETVTAPPAIVEAEPSSEVMDKELAALLKQAQAEGALMPIYFDYDKSNLKPDAKKNLDKTADWLTKKPTVNIKIEGNCDERGTAEYNLALGDRRANSAKEYLVKLGVSAARLATVSWGKEKPLCAEHNEACWSKNRRDDFNPTSK